MIKIATIITTITAVIDFEVEDSAKKDIKKPFFRRRFRDTFTTIKR